MVVVLLSAKSAAQGWSALHYAAVSGSSAMVQLLIDGKVPSLPRCPGRRPDWLVDGVMLVVVVVVVGS